MEDVKAFESNDFEEVLEFNENNNDESNVLDELMNKATVSGYLTTDDLLASFPEAEENMAQLEEIFIQLINQGIEVYADAEEAEEERRLKEQAPEEVTIPAGAKSGTKVRVAGAGPQGADGSSTDLILLIDVASHPDFVRKGDDLHTQVKVDVFTAILGGETQVNTLSGQVVLKIPPGTQPEQLIRISGRGMPHLKNSKQKGDLIVRIKVQIPRNLNEKQKSLLEELKKQITD